MKMMSKVEIIVTNIRTIMMRTVFKNQQNIGKYGNCVETSSDIPKKGYKQNIIVFVGHLIPDSKLNSMQLIEIIV